MSTAHQVPTAVILLGAGLLACFAGYRLFRVVLAIYGFIGGSMVAATLISPSTPFGVLAALVAGGLVGALLLYAGYIVGVMVVGAGLGAAAAHAIWTAWRGEPGALVIIVCAVVGAALAAAWQRHVVVLATAFLGAQSAVSGLVALLGVRVAGKTGIVDLFDGQVVALRAAAPWPVYAWLALAIVGTIVQLRSGGGTRRRRFR